MNTVKSDRMTRWIVVIPLWHLLKGTAKPFEPVPLVGSSRNEQSWAGLQGLKLAGASPSSEEGRYFILTHNSYLALSDSEILLNVQIFSNIV